ncbi:hypothetical protein EVAR_49216_1 [Eumeta japonica]|uniref:Uncharacterized protein n=1 Tax=Eumeta variegata TaxID=151549 RepID=A0A4C1XPJ4_EUMVA|nr:hypothetical protein EVAR_49216_1 [Eumeta japonica]
MSKQLNTEEEAADAEELIYGLYKTYPQLRSASPCGRSARARALTKAAIINSKRALAFKAPLNLSTMKIELPPRREHIEVRFNGKFNFDISWSGRRVSHYSKRTARRAAARGGGGGALSKLQRVAVELQGGADEAGQ